MAITNTTLASAIDGNTLALYATSPTGATVGGFARVDSEFMVITEIAGSRITVRGRGDQGTLAVSHGVLAPLTFGLMADLPTLPLYSTVPIPVNEEQLLSIGADGAIPVPNRNTSYFINKATALASSTMPNPTGAQDGLEVSFISNTDAAHVVTLVNAQDGTTGNHTTLTFPAFAGSGITLKAFRSRWLVKSNNLVAVS